MPLLLIILIAIVLRVVFFVGLVSGDPHTTGDSLLSYHIQSGANRFKYLHEAVSTFRWLALE